MGERVHSIIRREQDPVLLRRSDLYAIIYQLVNHFHMSSLANAHASSSAEANNAYGNSREQALAARALKRTKAKAEKTRKAEMHKEEVCF